MAATRTTAIATSFFLLILLTTLSSCSMAPAESEYAAKTVSHGQHEQNTKDEVEEENGKAGSRATRLARKLSLREFNRCFRRFSPESKWQGLASWYGKRQNKRRTASGERFDMHALTAAHRTLPFGTKVEVKNLCSMQRIVVTINDRGPRARKRLIDVSYGAAKKNRSPPSRGLSRGNFDS